MSVDYDAQIDENGQYIKVWENDMSSFVKVHDIFGAEISEKVNGEYTFIFDTVLNENTINVIAPKKIIEVDNDYFRLRKMVKKRGSNSIYSVDCEHISYRLNDDENPAYEGDVYFDYPENIIKDIIKDDHSFEFYYTDFWTNKISFETSAPGRRARIIELAKALGGEAQFHHFYVSIIQKRGTDHGLKLEMGKNILGVSKTTEIGKNEDTLKDSIEVEVVDLRFVKDDNTGLPLEQHDIHLGDVVELNDPLLGLTNYKTRVLAISYDPYKHLLPRLELENKQEDIYNDSSSSATTTNANVYFFRENSNTINLGTSEMSIIDQDLLGMRDTYYDVSLTINVTVTTVPTSINFYFQVGDTKFGNYTHQFNHSGKYVVDVDRFINNIDKGLQVLHVMAKTLQNTVVIEPKALTMLVRTFGVLGGAKQEKPDRAVIDNLSLTFSKPIIGANEDLVDVILINESNLETLEDDFNLSWGLLRVLDEDSVTVIVEG